MRTSATLIVGAAISLIAVAAQAAPVVYDFDNLVTSSLETAPPAWTLVEGDVDHIANTNDWGIRCAGNAGGCVDLDGGGNAGLSPTIRTTDHVALAAGTYRLTFDLSGNQRSSSVDSWNYAIRTSDSVLGPTLLSDSGSIAGGLNLVNFSTFSSLFTLAAPTNVFLFFGTTSSGNNIGPILDNVALTAVPLPAAAWLLLSGLGALGAFSRRRAAAVSQG
jgi:hypothetical protein